MPRVVDIELSQPQKQLVLSNSKYPAMVAGLGSGKTFAATVRFLIKIMSERGINCCLGMPTYDLIDTRAIPGFEETLGEIGLPYTKNGSKYFIEILGHGRIYFRSYDKPERWVAFEVAHTLLDELDTLKKEKAKLIWRKAKERTRQKCNGINTIGAITTPDQGIHGFVFQEWVKKKTDDHELIKASTHSNQKNLPDDYIEQIRSSYDPVLAELYINGDFVNLSQNKVYHFFDRKKHHTDRVIQKSDRLFVGIDFNVGGCCATTWVLQGKGAAALDEFISHDTRDFCNNLTARYKGHNIVVYPDASGDSRSTNATQTDIDIIRGAGFAVDAPNKNPPVRDRINCVNGLLAHDRMFVNCDKCPELAYALESQGYTDKGEPEKFDDHPAIDDWNDSAGYFIHKRFPIRSAIRGVPVG